MSGVARAGPMEVREAQPRPSPAGPRARRGRAASPPSRRAGTARAWRSRPRRSRARTRAARRSRRSTRQRQPERRVGASSQPRIGTRAGSSGSRNSAPPGIRIARRERPEREGGGGEQAVQRGERERRRINAELAAATGRMSFSHVSASTGNAAPQHNADQHAKRGERHHLDQADREAPSAPMRRGSAASRSCGACIEPGADPVRDADARRRAARSVRPAS